MKRLGILSLFALLFIAFITIWNNSYQAGLEEAYIPLTNVHPTPIIPSEKGVFERESFTLDYANMPYDNNYERELNAYYSNRAFPGAPPSIPHAVSDERNIGENSCLQCHENGGFVNKWKAYAPVTPHPEMVNCRQCHVVQNTQTLFRANNFYKTSAPKTGVNKALIGSPPVIPHQIEMRENCLSCHAGPAAPKEIKVLHPERSNCRQCHVLKNKEVNDGGIFIRKNTNNE